MKNDLARFLTGDKTWADFKDSAVTAVCNLLLNKVASREYRDKLALVIVHGLNEAEAGRVPGLQKKAS